ncbi:MAG: penicillin acylase family protein [Ignavibacteriae bacterium]|nr:penicillin acylase family protein [Ignavibacteriota bacterium]NOG97305.1 penicillin acylase family protein [Ignavibacteriota bacterium]
MKKWVKILIASLSTIFVVIAVSIIAAYILIRQPLPNYDGAENVVGISDEVNIYRTENAVPYIIAKTEEDAAFALGYVHAQERMFQMDLMRRAAEGKLSEILGTKTIAVDKLFKTVGLYKKAVEHYSLLDENSKNILTVYSKGINSYLAERKGNLSIEFDVLGYEPEQWIPEHSYVIAKLLAWELNISWWTDIAFTHLVQKLGEEKVKEIIPDFPENAPVIIPNEIKRFTNLSTDIIKADRQYRELFGIRGTHLGSNNWVVNGKMSTSGKPIIANDPHLMLGTPAKWFMAVIRSDTWNTEGFTLPGLPAVVIGKNKSIAWVVTNVMADDADFYVEEIDSSKNNYLLDGKWQPLIKLNEEIIVKDSANVEFTISHTHRGPIVSDVYSIDLGKNKKTESNAELSMRWTALDFSNDFSAILNVNKAENWDDFKDALEDFNAPGQNFVYADTLGNIGYICAAKLPKRKNDSPTFVYDGTASENDWNGFIPYRLMPTLYNPNQNYIASANNKTVKDFPYHISNLWEPPSRIISIDSMLNSKEKHSAEDFKSYQSNIYSPFAKGITAEILSAFENVIVKDDNLKLAIELLEKWNYEMDRFSQAPSIYSVFMQKLIQNIFLDEMGEELFEEYIFMANVPMRVVPKLLSKGNSIWFDNVTTEKIENKNDIIRKSFTDALAELESNFGSKISEWQWGELHTVKFEHFFSGASSVIDQIINIGPFPISGDGTTVSLSEYSLNKPYETVIGPSMRFIYDFAQPEKINFILPTGQSGHVMSDHYSDMTKLWLKGEYLELDLNIDSLMNKQHHQFQLLPE